MGFLDFFARCLFASFHFAACFDAQKCQALSALFGWCAVVD